jgi:tetratricopeptide (TPR) repeat protein
LPPDLRALLEESEEEPSVLVTGEPEDLDQGMVDDLAEAEFYLSQGMGEEAGSVLRRMQARAPQHPAVETLRAKLAAARPAAAAAAPGSPPVPPAEPAIESETAEISVEPAFGTSASEEPESAPEALHIEQAPLLDQGMEGFPGLEDLATEASLLQAPAPVSDGEPPAPEAALAPEGTADPRFDAGPLTDPGGPGEPVVPKFTVQGESAFSDTAAFIDLGKELEAEMAAEEKAAAATRGGALVSELLKEFQKGVREQLDEKDFETHYNLGIAYKEMDLYDEAIQEFRLAAGDPGRALTCANLMGLCHLSKGDTAEAIRELKAGLEISGHPREAYHSLHYDLGVAFEASGDLGLALECYETLQGQNARFRDVRVRAKTLRDRLRAKAAEVVPVPAPPAPVPTAVTETALPASPPAAPGPARRVTPKKKISFV